MAMAPSAASACSAVSFPARPAAASCSRPRTGAVRASAAKSSGNGKWWAPLLGWSGKVEAPAPAPKVPKDDAARRQFVGVMTEEKARELRARMAQMESLHDAMYHSAIASRLGGARLHAQPPDRL